MEADVAVIGAGPAGSTLATLLAKRGVRVVLVDRDTFPRDKVCGEFLSPDALPILDRLGLSAALDQLRSPWMSRCVIYSGRRRLEFELPSPARGVSRRALDKLLFDGAVAAGAIPLTGNSADLRDGRVVAGDESINATVVVGAWGRWGRIDQTLQREFISDRPHRYFGFKRHYQSGGRSTDAIELHSFRAGYLGAGAIENSMVNLCGLVHHSRIRGMKEGWQTLVTEISAEQESLFHLFASYEPEDEEFLSSEPVIFVAKSPVERGIFLLGDAAGLVDPLTGSGMAVAIQSALLAAPIIIERLGGSITAEESYRARFREFFENRLRWSRRIAFVLARPALLSGALTLPSSRNVGKWLVRKTRADSEAVQRALAHWFS